MSASMADQSTYQVRYAWGAGGAAELADAHLVVLVDGLSAEASPEAVAELAGSLTPDTRILTASLRNRSAVAERVTALQAELGDRAVVNIIASGRGRGATGASGESGASVRFEVADILAAGAVIDALVERGIDHISPEAAVACAAYSGLKRASKHLINASSGGRAVRAAGDEEALGAALQLDASVEVPELTVR